MNTQTTAARELNEEISNAEVPPRGNQVPPLEEVTNDDQAPVNPSLLIDGYIRAAFLQMSQDIITEAQSGTTKAQSMIAQTNREVVPPANNHVGTITRRLRV